MKIALDAMGGDHAPSVTVAGAVDFVNVCKDTDIILVGDEGVLGKELSKKKFPGSRIEVIHASETIDMDEAPMSAIRKKKDSSLAKSVDLVRNKQADAVVSAGNSGATMALALLRFGKIPGVVRPAIATIMPVFRQPFVLLDAGANVDCSPSNLLQFAYMGNAYCRLILDRPKPKVALLSIGEESGKGNELTKEAYKLLQKTDLNFIGNVESKDMFFGRADVVVCDGFAGNIVLKTSEGVAEGTIRMLKREIVKILTGRLGYALLKPAFDSFKRMTDYAEYGGAPLLGINGNCIISHGRSSSVAIRNALRIAADFAQSKVQETIARDISAVAVPSENTVVTG
jgi:glycerol-3-phosphate acyltransferase PlsX